ncbi:MAG: hypothetical protein QM760_16520 [Nibricoccus sp.]
MAAHSRANPARSPSSAPEKSPAPGRKIPTTRSCSPPIKARASRPPPTASSSNQLPATGSSPTTRTKPPTTASAARCFSNLSNGPPNGWWRPIAGKAPALTTPAPLPAVTNGFTLAESDEFNSPTLGLQWFFTTAPDWTGKSWSLTENPGQLRVFTQPGDLSSISALTGIVQQRVTRKAFSIETRVTFDAKDAHETAGLHFYHDPRMNFWLGVSTDKGEPLLVIGKTDQGKRTDLWSVKNPHGKTVHLRIVVDGEERATFFHSGDGQRWEKIGESIYFGASGHHLRNGERGSPDLGWVGVYKDPEASRALGLPEYLSPEESKIYFTGTTGRPERPGNVWTGATFGLFAIRDGAAKSKPADFDYLRVTASPDPAKP